MDKQSVSICNQHGGMALDTADAERMAAILDFGAGIFGSDFRETVREFCNVLRCWPREGAPQPDKAARLARRRRARTVVS